MRLVLAVCLVVLAAPLGGCYHSTTELIPADEAVFPFERLTYKTDDEDEVYTLVRQGTVYVDPEDEAAPKVRFKQLRPGVYLAQGHFVIQEASFYAAGTVHAVLGEAAAELYAGFADISGPPAEAMKAHGFDACDQMDGMICLDGAEAYVDYALGLVDAGGKPDKTFTILSYE